MGNAHYPIVQVPERGTYYLIEASKLGGGLIANNWLALLNIPASGLGALAFTVRYFRESKNLSLLQLSKKTGIHRTQLTRLEQAKLARRPQKSTIDRLIGIFGPLFREILILQGNYSDENSE